MSLKAFHILFVVASICLCFGFGGWCLKGYAADHQTSQLILGVVAVTMGVGLIFYGRAVLKKLKDISML